VFLAEWECVVLLCHDFVKNFIRLDQQHIMRLLHLGSKFGVGKPSWTVSCDVCDSSDIMDCLSTGSCSSSATLDISASSIISSGAFDHQWTEYCRWVRNHASRSESSVDNLASTKGWALWAVCEYSLYPVVRSKLYHARSNHFCSVCVVSRYLLAASLPCFPGAPDFHIAVQLRIPVTRVSKQKCVCAE
jgi:hypothetical protein